MIFRAYVVPAYSFGFSPLVRSATAVLVFVPSTIEMVPRLSRGVSACSAVPERANVDTATESAKRSVNAFFSVLFIFPPVSKTSVK